MCYRYTTNSSPKGSQAAYLNGSMKFNKRIQEDKLITACILHTYSKSKGKISTCAADFSKLAPLSS